MSVVCNLGRNKKYKVIYVRGNASNWYLEEEEKQAHGLCSPQTY